MMTDRQFYLALIGFFVLAPSFPLVAYALFRLVTN
jgi:hypothetical protein